jgi:predicted nucleotidyltransferase component of viral defense system
MIDRAYVDTVTLLLSVVPRVFATNRLALKGGTAINLYLDDMPRLSVDLDVVFTPIQLERQVALAAINDEMRRIVDAATSDGLSARDHDDTGRRNRTRHRQWTCAGQGRDQHRLSRHPAGTRGSFAIGWCVRPLGH